MCSAASLTSLKLLFHLGQESSRASVDQEIKCIFMDPQTIPLGCKFKFDPEDHELLIYLECKCNGEPLPWEGFINEVDLYQLPDPGALFKGTEKKVVYVFTKLKKVAKNGKRVERSISGNRTWKGVDGGKPIYNAEGRPVGEKKNFVLVNKMKMKLGYNMTEFSLDNDILRNSRFKDYVVCKIKKKAKNFRSLKYGDIPEEDICPSSVSTPAIEGDLMAMSEERYQSQKKEEEHFSESHQRSNFMPMLCGDLGSELSSGYFGPNTYQEVSSWTIDDALAELDNLNIPPLG